MLMTIHDRIKNGEMIVAQHYKADGKTGFKVGDRYNMNYQDYKVIEICDGDLEGYVWIKRDNS